MTRRERLECKLEKRADWAASRDAKSEAAFNRSRTIADGIPLGQPILVGHHSERRHRRDIERIDNGMRAGVESAKMAEHHRSKAAGLADQLAGSIFSDDEDAPERIRERLAELEARREAMKRGNRAWKRGGKGEGGALALRAEVGDEMALEGLTTLRVCPYHGAPFPSYALSNLGGNISRLRKRLADVEVMAQRRAAAEAGGGVHIEGADYVRVTFAEKPERAILDALRGAGFHWSGGGWCGRRADLPEALTVRLDCTGPGIFHADIRPSTIGGKS